MNHFKEKAMKCVFLIAACTSVLAVFLICAFLFANGVPAIGKIGPLKFLLGTKWKPSNDIFGILPMIVASIYVYLCFYGTLLPEENLQTIEIRN